MTLDTPAAALELAKRIAAATTDLASAQRELLSVLEGTPAAVRADKKIISEALQTALGKVSAAKRTLDIALAEQSDDP